MSRLKTLNLINTQIKRALSTPYYQNKGLKEIKDLSEIKNLPLTSKENLRQAFPFGLLAIPSDQIARFNASSGTTGTPTISYFSKHDIEIHKKNEANHFSRAGITKNSTIQLMSPLSLFAAGWCCYAGTSKIGASLIPSGPGNTKKQINLLSQLGADCCFSTPSYLQYLLANMTNSDFSDIKLKKAITGGEPLSKNFQQLALEKYGIEIYNFYGMTEVSSHIASECSFHNGLHIAENYFYVEIINPDTEEVLPYGEQGELVITPLQQEAMPLIRYRTGDITCFIPETCPCGCTQKRIMPITHRKDDMMIINGVNIFPSQIEECIYKHVPMSTNYLIHIIEKDGLKKLLIDIEISADLLSDLNYLEILEKALISTLRSYITISPKLNFVEKGSLCEICGKTKRIVQE